MNKTIYQLNLHEVIQVEVDDKYLFTTVMAVPGGWIYRSYDKSHSMMSCVFVPYSQTLLI
jgi:hypothetical protein